jgi:hypothetical protein
MVFLPADFYHTRVDSIDNLDQMVIGHAIGTMLVFDQIGLNSGVQ